MFARTEDIESCQGERFKLEVAADHYNLHWEMGGDWLLLYRFERESDTGLPRPSDRETTLQLCSQLYTSPGFIPIRDKYIKISRQTNDTKIGKLSKITHK